MLRIVKVGIRRDSWLSSEEAGELFKKIDAGWRPATPILLLHFATPELLAVNLSEERLRILNTLYGSPLSTKELADLLGCPEGAVSADLQALKGHGLLRKYAGKWRVRFDVLEIEGVTILGTEESPLTPPTSKQRK